MKLRGPRFGRGPRNAGYFMAAEDFIRAVVLLLVGIPVVYYDLRFNRIPNFLTYPGILLGLAFLVFARNDQFLGHSLAFVAGFGLFYAFYLFGWVGGGDAKLMGMIGILMGLDFLVVALVYTALAGGAIALARIAVAMVKKESLRGVRIPYGTAIVAGTYYAVFRVVIY